MVDDTISLSALEKWLESNPSSALKAIVDAAKAAGQSVADMGAITAQVGPAMANQIKSAATATQTAIAALGQFGTAASEAFKSGSALWEKLSSETQNYIKTQQQATGDTRIFAAQSALVMESMIGLIPEGITGMGNFGQSGKVAGTTISESFKAISPVLDQIMGKANAAKFGRMVEGADHAYQVQHGLIALAASQGQLNGVIDSGTNSFKGINLVMSDMVETAYTAAVATGQTQSAMMNLAQDLGTIPGALSDVIKVGAQTSSQLVVTSQIATAFGRTQTEVAKQLTTMYDQMGLKGTESMQVISRMYEAAGNSKLRFEGFSKSVMDIAQNFKMLGDNTNAATTVVKAFDTAFKDSEISPAAMQEVISGMASGIQKMDRGRQAFISGATGGPGGLAGAFQMELAMQEGRMDEVMQKTMTAMQSQFGGQVLTLKDAAANPALAGEFYKQVQYLTQVAGVAKDDRDAYRILEAMKNGVTDMLRPGAPGQPAEGAKALHDATARGAAEQTRTTSAIVEGNRILERTRMMQANQLGQLNTQISKSPLFGTADRTTRGIGIAGGTGVRDLATSEMSRGMIKQTMSDEKRLTHTIGTVESSPVGGFIKSVVDIAGGTPAGTPGTPTPGAPALPRRAPATPASLTAGGAGGRSPLDVFAETGQFPVSIEHSPIEVKVDLGEPFNRAVTTIARREIQGARAAQGRQADTGT